MTRGLFEIRVTVGPGDLDANGHVNNVRYVQWIQDVAWEHSAACGWLAERYVESGIAWVVREHRIRYLRPARLGDAVRVQTWVKRFGKATAKRGVRFLDAEGGTVLARAETDWALVDGDGRPVAIPTPLRDAFAEVADP